MKPLRKIEPGGYHNTQFSAEDIGVDVTTWLVKQAEHHGLTRLLAHADDGVIWGQMVNGALQTSHDVFGDPPSPELRATTLQQVRIFSEQAELLLWRSPHGWRARLTEDAPDIGEHYNQAQLLWGNRYVTSRDGFTLVAEGRQGLRHAPPAEVAETAFDDERHPLYLQVRHYLATDPETGVVDVALSRLVGVGFETEEVAS
jgi:CRISPR-associated protein (TIGR03984 family)